LGRGLTFERATILRSCFAACAALALLCLSTGANANSSRTSAPRQHDVPLESPDAAIAWERISEPSAPPPPRDQHAAILDAPRRRLIVFGGLSSGALRNDLWALPLEEGAVWEALVAFGNAPSPRRGHSAVYDPVNDRMIVFGGFDGSYRADAWQLDLSPSSPEWSQLASAPLLGAYGHSAVYDSIQRRMLVFGGSGQACCPTNETWALSLTGEPTWTRLMPAGPLPPPRAGHIGVFDARRNHMLIFGGRSHDVFYGTWALSLTEPPRWTRLNTSGVPPRREGCFGILDVVEDQLIVMGGWRGENCVETVEALSLAGDRPWRVLHSQKGDSPGGRCWASTLYDPVTDRMILYGGTDVDADAWAMTWFERPAQTSADARHILGAREERTDAFIAGSPNPNPFASTTALQMVVARSNEAALDVFDATGRRVRRIDCGRLAPGVHSVNWSGDDHLGRPVAAGVYFLRLQLGHESTTRKVIRR
jgi:FlgD Ig-like domain/Galactose oxidase, central domain